MAESAYARPRRCCDAFAGGLANLLEDLERPSPVQALLALPEREACGGGCPPGPPSGGRRITERIAEVEAELTGHQASLARLHQHRQPTATPPDAPTVQALLAAFPVHGTELRSLDPTDLRELFASLNLLVRYDHARHSARLQLTPDRGTRRSGGAIFQSVVCSGGRTRTYNHGLNRAPLCRLSYAGWMPGLPVRRSGRAGRDGTRAVGASSPQFPRPDGRRGRPLEP